MKTWFRNIARRRWVRVSAAVVAAWLLWLAAMWLATPAPLFDSPCATVAVAADGQLLGARISADQQWRFPPLAQTPEKIAAAQVL